MEGSGAEDASSAGVLPIGRRSQHSSAEDVGELSPSHLEFMHADSPPHVAISVQPPCSVPNSCSSTGRLLPGRQRILAIAARQLAASELLVEGLDVCAVDINTHALPPPSTPLLGAQGEPEESVSASPHRRHALELLRLHALLQAAVGVEQDLIIVGLHQVATQHRHAWAACVAAAFAAAEGQAATAIRTHLLGPEVSAADAAASATAAALRSTSFRNYEQIFPLNACPHHNQMLLVYVHPSHLHKVTLLSIAKSRLGSYCCRDLQHNYKHQWGLSAAVQGRLRQQWEQQRKHQLQQKQQQQMDLLFNFNTFFGLSDSAPAAAPAMNDPLSEAEETFSMSEPQAEAIPRTPLEPLGLSKRQTRRQQRVFRQQRKDRICCSRICSIPQCKFCCSSDCMSKTTGRSSRSSSTTPCGCEQFKEVFAYGGVAARLLIGATPVVVACVDLKLTEDKLESCTSGLSCRFCRTPQQRHAGPSAAATPAAAKLDVKTEPCGSSEGSAVSDEEGFSITWRRRVNRAVQRQQLLTILADLRFDTDSGWASALELKPLLLLGARGQRGLTTARRPHSGGEDSAAAGVKETSTAVNKSCPSVAATEQQRRLMELELLGVCTVEDSSFFFCRVPRKAGSHVLTLSESGRAAEWRRPAWSRRGGGPGLGVIARFWLRWMSCRLLVESVDTDRVKKQCNELRDTLRQEGRCLSKLLVDPPLLQLPPVRPFEPMQLKICLSNPHESLPTAYAVYCLADSGKSIVPLSHVSYWHGALWRHSEGGRSEVQSLGAASGTETEFTPTGAPQQQQQHRELLQQEQQRLQEEALHELTNTSQDSVVTQPGDAAFAITNEADAKTVLRRRIRLERWLLMDSLHGFLKGGETRVLSMTLNIQEGIYSEHELACGVLVLRLVDSRQDFFFCLAASLMPALLGAELQPLTLLGERPLLRGLVGETGSSGYAHQEQRAVYHESAPAANTQECHLAPPVAATDSDSAEASSSVASQLPLPKELWWLLMHLHAKLLAVATGALETSGWSLYPRRHRHRSYRAEQRKRTFAHVPALQTQNSISSVYSNGSATSIVSSGASSPSESDYSSSSCTQSRQMHSSQRKERHGREVFGLEIAAFLCTAGGQTLTWPSFLAGADTYLQPQRRFQSPGAACTGDDATAFDKECVSSSCKGGRRRGLKSWKSLNGSSTEDTAASGEPCHRQPLKRDVIFLRACLERGIAVPEGVSLCAALLLLEEWGATCCFFPSEFAVQDVQTDNLHLLCRAILLSLPLVHRNAFISVVSAINGLLQAATRSIMEASHQEHRQYRPMLSHPNSGETSDFGYSATNSANAADWVGCCPSGMVTTKSACSQICLEVLQSGERGSPAQRINCLESLRTRQLLRHALLLWTGAWLMKSCRPALRHAVLDHFFAPV